MNRQKIKSALVDLLADQAKQTTIAGCALIALVGAVLWFSFPKPQVIGWVLIGFAIAIPRYYFIGRVKNKLHPDESRFNLELIIAFALFTSGLHWGAAAWLFLDTNSVQNFALVCGAILGVIASALAIFSTRPLVCCIFATTVFCIAALKLAFLDNWGLAIMCMLVLPPYMILSRTLGRRIEKSVTQDFRNAELLEEVRATKDALEESSREKSLFMAATSHDLRQPLHAQSMILQIMDSRAQGTDLEDLVEKMMHSNEALIALFDALLEVSQLDAGTIAVRKSHHSLLDVAKLIIDEFQETATQKNLKLELVGDDCVVYSDPVLLMRILRNLVSNAIKFTEQGHVSLKIVERDQLVYASVCDTGIGISVSDQSTIFKEYTQLGNASRDRSKGIGLGLALVRRMCELLEHEIKMESELEAGSCFTVELPVGDLGSIVRLGNEPVTEIFRDLDIMIIDDEQPILDAMITLFTDWSCRASAYTSLADARSAIQGTNYRPDLIISDYRLNDGVNGVDTIKQLRQLLQEEVPAIIISGDTDPRLLEMIHEQEFYLLHKPVKVDKLRNVIRSLLNRQDYSQA